MIELKPAKKPGFLKIGFYGHTGTGKTYTAALILSQFIRDYFPDLQLAMYDTEGGSEYIAEMVKEITGKDLLSKVSQSFSGLLEFADICKEKKYVALLDSATHPWRALCSDYLAAKKQRVEQAKGRVETVRLSLKDWGPIKEMWAVFANKYRYDPVHWCLCGREGDVWGTEKDEEGNEEMRKTGTKMKTEVETGYEPSMLVQMRLVDKKHKAVVLKDRFHLLTGQEFDDPDIESFKPFIDSHNFKAKAIQPDPGKSLFHAGEGPNWETLKREREAILEEIKNDLVLAYPKRTDEAKKAKIELLRKAFNTSAWTELENNEKKFPAAALRAGRQMIEKLVKESK